MASRHEEGCHENTIFMYFLFCKGLSNTDVWVARGTVNRGIRPEAAYKAGEFVEEKLGGLPWNDSVRCSAIRVKGGLRPKNVICWADFGTMCVLCCVRTGASIGLGYFSAEMSCIPLRTACGADLTSARCACFLAYG